MSNKKRVVIHGDGALFGAWTNDPEIEVVFFSDQPDAADGAAVSIDSFQQHFSQGPEEAKHHLYRVHLDENDGLVNYYHNACNGLSSKLNVMLGMRFGIDYGPGSRKVKETRSNPTLRIHQLFSVKENYMCSAKVKVVLRYKGLQVHSFHLDGKVTAFEGEAYHPYRCQLNKPGALFDEVELSVEPGVVYEATID